mgnify:CR=1 FL=1
MFGQLATGVGQSANLKLVPLMKTEVNKNSNFFPLPWAVNELMLNKGRNQNIWYSGQFSGALYRLPRIITAAEASEVFRLPLGSSNVYAGFNVNEATKQSRSYTDNLINAGDITVGKLKSSSKGDTIGFSVKDLAKHMLIVGTPGSGKTTFAEKLQKCTGLPLYYLDAIWHKPDRTHISREEYDARLAEILALDSWIIDGNYSRTIETRISACDTVFLFDLPVDVCLDGAISRLGKERYGIHCAPQVRRIDLIDMHTKEIFSNSLRLLLTQLAKWHI